MSRGDGGGDIQEAGGCWSVGHWKLHSSSIHVVLKEDRLVSESCAEAMWAGLLVVVRSVL